MSGALALLLLAMPCNGVEAQYGPGITDSVVSHADASQGYALFVPSTNRPGTPHPLLVVLDSRGRALLPLQRIAPAAERLGWLVMSSYQARSDEAGLETDQAVIAMIEDAQDLFTIDPRRLYFAGLSGNARQSWLLAGAYEPYTAGIFGFGAALPGSSRLVEMTAEGPVGFSFFGGAGAIDYNNYEMRSLDWRLEEYGISHFVSFYPGGHEWPESSVFDEALEWMEVRAVRDGRFERSAEELRAFLQRRLELAAGLEAEGHVYDAWRVYRSIGTDFEGLLEVDAAREAAERLSSSPAFQKDVDRLRDEVEERVRFDERMAVWIEGVRRSLRPADVQAGVGALDLRRLMRTAQDTRSPHRARVAQEMLEDVFVQASFYQPRVYEAMERQELARRFFRVARLIKPDDFSACYGLARSAALLGDEGEAREGLECAAASGWLTGAALDGDAAFDRVRDEAWFVALRSAGGG